MQPQKLLVHLTCLASAFALGVAFVPVRAQVYSPRQLTQRIAPLLPPAPANAPRAPGAQSATRPSPVVVDPEQQAADRTEAAAKTDEFRKQRAEAESQTVKSDGQEINLPAVPLVVTCKKWQPDPQQSLQYVSLSLSNACPLAIDGVAIHLVYFGSKRDKLKEWTTHPELDQPLPAATTRELTQPAFFMPWNTDTVKVEVKEIHFSNGTVWPR